MSLFTSFFDKLKSHNYSIITAVVIGIYNSGLSLDYCAK